MTGMTAVLDIVDYGADSYPSSRDEDVGSTPEFVALFQEHYPRIRAYARRRVGNAVDAEDIASEVFRLALEQPITPSPGWLFVTARNKIMSFYQSVHHDNAVRDRVGSELVTYTDSDPGSERAETIRTALARMPELERELLMAAYWDDLTGAQCAELIGCSIGAVWVRLHRARKTFKSVLTSIDSQEETQ